MRGLRRRLANGVTATPDPSATSTSSKWYKRKSVIIGVAMVVAIAIVGNLSKPSDKGTAQASSAATTNAPAPAATPKTTDAASPSPSDSTQPDATTESENGANPFGGDAPEDRLMPNVVCMNLQDAQDEIQDHGVILSRSVDATGKGRHQVLDRNWVVVGQSPAAGAAIGELDAELSVVKYGETTQCG